MPPAGRASTIQPEPAGKLVDKVGLLNTFEQHPGYGNTGGHFTQVISGPQLVQLEIGCYPAKGQGAVS